MTLEPSQNERSLPEVVTRLGRSISSLDEEQACRLHDSTRIEDENEDCSFRTPRFRLRFSLGIRQFSLDRT